MGGTQAAAAAGGEQSGMFSQPGLSIKGRSASRAGSAAHQRIPARPPRPLPIELPDRRVQRRGKADPCQIRQ